MAMARRTEMLMSMILLVIVRRKDGMNETVLMLRIGIGVMSTGMTMDERNDGHP